MSACYVCPNTASLVETAAGLAEVCDGCGDETKACLCPGDPVADAEAEYPA